MATTSGCSKDRLEVVPSVNTDGHFSATWPTQSSVYSVFLHCLFGCHGTNVSASLNLVYFCDFHFSLFLPTS